MRDRGSYVEYDGRPAVRFIRTYAHPVQRVWAAVTEPEQLAAWFPSAVRMQPQVGGRIDFTGDPYAEDTTGTVLVYDPPHQLAYTWGEDELHFELAATDGGCTLTLINVLDERAAAARNAAGWDACIAQLDKLLAAEPTQGAHSDDPGQWQQLYERYVADGLPAGAPMPDLP